VGAAYELGALYPLYLTCPFGFLEYNITYPKKKGEQDQIFFEV
jgi:hypothetical protein